MLIIAAGSTKPRSANDATNFHAGEAAAAGVLGLSVGLPEQVRPSLEKALAHKGPALVEVSVNRRELSMPPSLSLDQAAGFGIFPMKAVLSGRGDEVIDLAKTNLQR